jgi:energy-coupling factor transporter ATP-binding protein EcfA2
MRDQISLKTNRRYISRIAVDKLFGRYTYDLRLKQTQSPNLLILYGDNGSGKTTILDLVFHLLTHIHGGGHKTFVSKVPFRKLSVELGDSVKVIAQRPKSRVVGTYTASIQRRGKRTVTVTFRANKQGDVRLTPELRRKVDVFLAKLAELKIALFYLKDDRELLSNTTAAKKTEDARKHRLSEGRIRFVERSDTPVKQIDSALHRAIKHALEWTQEQVLRGSTQGDTDANTIYADIVLRLASASHRARTFDAPNLRRLTSMLEDQERRSSEFAKYGLPSARNISQLVSSLKRSHKDISTVYKIVEPYVDGLKAKLDALQEVQQSIASFVNAVNSFFIDKSVHFDLTNGITIVGGNVTLPPKDLSSGEKQLLLLFCNTLINRNEDTIFVIDEPEISLNIKWQRKLIRSLLSSTTGRNIQFVLATHSFELFAPHDRSVTKLENLHNEKSKRTS